MHEGSRDEGIRRAVPAVIAALSQGERVCVHCHHSFHRGPVLYAALCRSLFGINAQTSMEILSQRRFIWWEHIHGRHTGSQLSRAAEWASKLQRWLPATLSARGSVAACLPSALARAAPGAPVASAAVPPTLPPWQAHWRVAGGQGATHHTGFEPRWQIPVPRNDG